MQTAEWKQPGINPPLLVNVSAHTYSPQGTQEEVHAPTFRRMQRDSLNHTK